MFCSASDFMQRASDYKSTLYIVLIRKWEEHSMYAFGLVESNYTSYTFQHHYFILFTQFNLIYDFRSLVKCLGQRGDIKAETEAILLENDVDFSEFPSQLTNDLPKNSWKISEVPIAVYMSVPKLRF